MMLYLESVLFLVVATSAIFAAVVWCWFILGFVLKRFFEDAEMMDMLKGSQKGFKIWFISLCIVHVTILAPMLALAVSCDSTKGGGCGKVDTARSGVSVKFRASDRALDFDN
jgi:hypothetical protein